MLDLGAGTGLLANKIYDKVKKVVAVEPFEEFTKYIVKADNIIIKNETIQNYAFDDTFDAILLFGVVQYFNKEEVIKIYNKCKYALKPDGVLIIKNQFGILEDVVIDGWAENLKKYYISEYRQIDSEINLLKDNCFSCVEKFDIYPAECNRWDNTHFYAIVASRGEINNG